MGLLRLGGEHVLRWPRLLGIALVAIWVAGLHAGSLFERRSLPEEVGPGVVLLYNWLHFPAYASLAIWMLLALGAAPARNHERAQGGSLHLRAFGWTALVADLILDPPATATPLGADRTR